MVPACSSDTLTNVLPHRNVMPPTQDMAPHPVTVCRHGVDLSLCYPLMWNVAMEYTATHLSWVTPDLEILPRSSTHTSERFMIGDRDSYNVFKCQAISPKLLC